MPVTWPPPLVEVVILRKEWNKQNSGGIERLKCIWSPSTVKRRMHFQSFLSVPLKRLKGTAGLIKWWLVQILASHLGKGASRPKLELHLEGQGWIGTDLFLRGESGFHVSISGRCLIPFSLAEASLSHLSDHQQNEDLLPSCSPQACVWLLLFGCGFSGSLPRSTLSYSQQYLKKLWSRVEIWRKYFSFPLNVTLLILVLIQTSDKPIR